MKDKYSYYDLVFEVTRQIPEGRVSSYGAIADFLALGSARMVGWALNKCGPDIPAHRVVNSKGELSGRNNFPDSTYMQAQLESEGLKIKNNKVVNFKEVYLHPEMMDSL